jgi:hypothetical protein
MSGSLGPLWVHARNNSCLHLRSSLAGMFPLGLKDKIYHKCWLFDLHCFLCFMLSVIKGLWYFKFLLGDLWNYHMLYLVSLSNRPIELTWGHVASCCIGFFIHNLYIMQHTCSINEKTSILHYVSMIHNVLLNLQILWVYCCGVVA